MIRRRLKLAFLALLACTFTVFVYINTYEVVFNQDLPFGISLGRMAAQDLINNTVREFATKPGSGQQYSSESSLEDIEYFEISALNVRVNLEAGRKINGQWYQRPSLAGYIGLNKNSTGTVIDYLVYTDQSWLTIPAPEQIETGMEVTFFHKGGDESHFKIAEKETSPLNRSLIVDKSEERQILLLVEDPHDQVYFGYSLVQDK